MRDIDLLRAVMQNDLATFAKRSIAELMPSLTLEWNWHHDLICDRLMQLADGQVSHLLICIPPRGLKSLLCSVVYPAWLLARDAAAQILCISYAEKLAKDFARRCRQLMESRFYQLCCDTRISRARRAAEQFETTAGGQRIASSVHGTVTGRGGGVIILDDPMKPEDAYSESGRRATMDWLRNTLVSRPDDKRNVRMLVIMQRLHQEDLAGYLLEQGGWDTVILPAIATCDERHQYKVAGRQAVTCRAPGDLLHPERETSEVIAGERRKMSELTFSAQYQQNPLPIEGNLLKRSWIRFYEPHEALNPDRVIQSWDTGSKTSEANDYSVCTTWAVRSGTIYLLDVWHGRLEMPDLCRKVVELEARCSPERVLVEDKGAGTGLIQALRAQGFHKVIPCIPRGSKIERFEAITPRFEGGHVLLPRHAVWLEPYLQELCGFPNTRHDDQVDSTSQALSYISTPKPGQGFLDYAAMFGEDDD